MLCPIASSWLSLLRVCFRICDLHDIRTDRVTGTGGSFFNALLAKIFHDKSSRTILVVCHTDEGLDRCLENLLDIGVPGSHILRLGDGTTSRTKKLALRKLQGKRKNRPKLKNADWKEVNSLRSESHVLRDRLDQLFDKYKDHRPRPQEFLDYLEFEDPEFFTAFDVPKNKDGKRFKNLGPFYLYQRWLAGKHDAGDLEDTPQESAAAPRIWGMSSPDREETRTRWRQGMLRELVEELFEVGAEYNAVLESIEQRLRGNLATTLIGRKIVGCTVEMVGKYNDDIQATKPGVVVIEEAGRVLEGYVLAALAPQTEQLVLIGDHR